MTRADTVLVAIDDTEASERAVNAAARDLAGHPDRHVLLFHVLPTLPTELLEFGGRADDAEEIAGLEQLRERRRAWMQEERRKARPIVDRMKGVLRDAGVSDEQIETAADAPNPECTIAQEILRAARDRSITKIFVGHESFPWHRELFHRHVGEDLAHRAEAESVSIVGTSYVF